MSARDHLREAIDRQQLRLREAVPLDREAAIQALLRAIDQIAPSRGNAPIPDLISGHRLANLGGTKALQFCLEEPSERQNLGDIDAWAVRFLADCHHLAEAELVITHCETGFMRVLNGDRSSIDAWIATKRLPTSWRERSDIDWWAKSLADSNESDAMAYQLGYPQDALLGGCTVETYRRVLNWLVPQEPGAQSESETIRSIGTDLAIDPETIKIALASFTLDRENAAYHAAVPGVAAAPIIRIGQDRIALSRFGLLSEPLLFLTREIRRRDAQEYHNSAYLRETVFRDDLYALFQDKRFVASTGRINLRKTGGEVRTDIDAAVFDRKSGTLGLFELKSQDPFARSTAELTRQRDNFLFANRQVSGTLDWIKRHGADEIVARIDSRAAKTFRAHKVYPFVLGRFLAHFNDGAEPDRRAAWGTWPQVLRLLETQPMQPTDANPIASLFTRLSKDPPPGITLPGEHRVIDLGETRLTVYPSYSAFQASTKPASE
ncbi:hypothetical protein BH09CHL1_BH09CHL1_32100 [soil metagenome]